MIEQKEAPLFPKIAKKWQKQLLLKKDIFQNSSKIA